MQRRLLQERRPGTSSRVQSAKGPAQYPLSSVPPNPPTGVLIRRSYLCVMGSRGDTGSRLCDSGGRRRVVTHRSHRCGSVTVASPLSLGSHRPSVWLFGRAIPSWFSTIPSWAIPSRFSDALAACIFPVDCHAACLLLLLDSCCFSTLTGSAHPHVAAAAAALSCQVRLSQRGLVPGGLC
jgi:hypothetical protein